MDSDKIEGYLVRSGVSYDALEDNIWIVGDELQDVSNIVINLADPVIVFRVKLMTIPENEEKQGQLFKTLLELNASEMLAGAYAIDDDSVIALVTLQSENLDYNEFQAAIDGLTLAITDHYETLKQFHSLAAD